MSIKMVADLRIRLCVAIAALAAFVAFVAVAGAAFSTPVDLSATGQDSLLPQIATDADGDAVAVWQRLGSNHRVQARSISAAGVRGPIRTLSAAGQHARFADIATDADGDAVAVWLRADGLWRAQARTISPAGVLGPIKTLSAAGASAGFPQVASDADGDAVAVWARHDGSNNRVQARTISAAGARGPIRNLSAAGASAGRPQIASDADGGAVVVWGRHDGSNYRVQARTISAAGIRGPIRTLSAAGQHARDPQIATDADGDAVAVWRRFDGLSDRVQARTISAAGVRGPIWTLSDAGRNGFAPQIATDADGDAVAVWRKDLANDRVQARTISAAGIRGPIRTLSADGQSAGNPEIATDADGGAIAVWPYGYPNWRVQARTISAAGIRGPIRTLSAAGQPAAESQIATDADGDAIAVWTRWDGSYDRIQASRGP